MTSDKLAYWDIQFCFLHNPQNNSYFDVFQVSMGGGGGGGHETVRGEREAHLKNAKITSDLQHYQENRVGTGDNL